MITIGCRKILGCLFACFLAQDGLTKDFLITDYGAKPDIINTGPISKAIQACYDNGGGRVVIPSGVFKSGTIVMKPNVELHLEIGSTLLASTDLKEFPVQAQATYRSQKDAGGWRALIYANEVSNIAITGLGTIDGNGAGQKPDPNSAFTRDLDGRPRNILFISCKYVRVEGIRMLNAGIWNQHYLNCEDVVVDRVHVYNHANRNNDGIDIDGCRRFTLSNSTFDTDDDAIVLKSTGMAACEDIAITNCIVSSFCNAIKAGTESTGGFKNISVSNCVIKPSIHPHPPVYGTVRGIAGLSLEIVDGGVMDGVTISNITIEGTNCPIFVRLGNRARKHIKEAPVPPVGIMRNIIISNVTASHTGNFSSSITAIPGHYVENLILSNVQLQNKGGLKSGDYISDILKVKEDEQGYPEPTAWKELPSSALFIRHAKNIQVRGLMLSPEEADPRIPVIAVDVAGLQIQSVSKISNTGSGVFFKGVNVKDIDIEKPLGWEKKVVQLVN
ncbi:glycoside hydrolase family 28 protein [Arcticibacter tournemirensis]|uniref:Polygalacturonase n=1 Tax=Arcticibacter tournemirensis TaxID=699437 RepID=A0A4Q0MA58_9SPHI|nr:glycosyl hydrolase family 28 protein [Arcticibacter tournemirensis]RXF70111.1 polygalacturonase [Arcticibacter tournemirensis]